MSDFPILEKLMMDPALVDVIEDDILLQLDAESEEKVLRKVKPDTCIDKVPSINAFIRSTITKRTENHVAIIDKTGEHP